MTVQLVITEKSSQARDVRAAVGSRYGKVLAAEGHLLELREPEDVNPGWKRWSTELPRPDGLYGTKPASGGNKAAKLKAIRAALKTADRVLIATDCDREGQLIGQEILEHCRYRGEVLRVTRQQGPVAHPVVRSGHIVRRQRGQCAGKRRGVRTRWAGPRPGPAEAQVEKAMATPVGNDYNKGLSAGISPRVPMTWSDAAGNRRRSVSVPSGRGEGHRLVRTVARLPYPWSWDSSG